MTDNPFRVLGLQRHATAAEVRSARRDLAREHHPDVGGDADAMRRINDAAAAALKSLSTQAQSERGASAHDSSERNVDGHAERPDAASGEATTAHRGADWDISTRDVPSFTVEALPAEAFEALLVATRSLGEVDNDDPPYELSVLMWPPLACWCQLDVVPDAGASTVSITIAAASDAPRPPLVAVRNAWIAALNELDWSAL